MRLGFSCFCFAVCFSVVASYAAAETLSLTAPDRCASLTTLKEDISGSLSDLGMGSSAMATLKSCKSKMTDLTKMSSADVAEKTSQARQQNSNKGKAKVCSELSGTDGSKCGAFFATSAGGLQKQLDKLQKERNEFKDKNDQKQMDALQNQASDQQNIQEALEAMRAEQIKQVSGLPLAKQGELLKANQDEQKSMAELDMQMADLNGKFAAALSLQAKSMSAIKVKCDQDARAEYAIKLKQLADVKAGATLNRNNVSSSMVVSITNQLKTYIARSSAACENGVSGVEQQKQIQDDLIAAKADLQSKVDALNTQRALFSRQLAQNETMIQQKYAALMLQSQSDYQLKAQHYQQLVQAQMSKSMLMNQQTQGNQQYQDGLDNKINNLQAMLKCYTDAGIEADSSDDDDEKPMKIDKVISKLKTLQDSCVGPNQCTPACNGVNDYTPPTADPQPPPSGAKASLPSGQSKPTKTTSGSGTGN